MTQPSIFWLPFPLKKTMVNQNLLVDKFGSTMSRNRHLRVHNKRGWSRFNISRTSPEHKELMQKINISVESQIKPKGHHADGSLMLSHMQNLNVRIQKEKDEPLFWKKYKKYLVYKKE